MHLRPAKSPFPWTNISLGTCQAAPPCSQGSASNLPTTVVTRGTNGVHPSVPGDGGHWPPRAPVPGTSREKSLRGPTSIDEHLIVPGVGTHTRTYSCRCGYPQISGYPAHPPYGFPSEWPWPAARRHLRQTARATANLEKTAWVASNKPSTHHTCVGGPFAAPAVCDLSDSPRVYGAAGCCATIAIVDAIEPPRTNRCYPASFQT